MNSRWFCSKSSCFFHETLMQVFCQMWGTNNLSLCSPSLLRFSSNESERDCESLFLKRTMSIIKVSYITNLLCFKWYERFLWETDLNLIPYWTDMVTIHFHWMKKSCLVILLNNFSGGRLKVIWLWNNMRLSKLFLCLCYHCKMSFPVGLFYRRLKVIRNCFYFTFLPFVNTCAFAFQISLLPANRRGMF